ncbi:hypothetical protein X953_17040 [Virgibacillus sp. SK37]|nr:hypothetical protein X953_17040 [Virgibacillus sp. SK37]
MASAASSATLRAGSSAHAIPAGVAPFRSNQFMSFKIPNVEWAFHLRLAMQSL